MDFNKYSEISLKRESLRQSEIAQRMSDLENQRVLHALIGITTEAVEITEAYTGKSYSEVDVINLIEEIGDIAFYANILLDVYNISWEDVAKKESLKFFSQRDTADQILIEAGNALDIFKKALFYGKEIEKELVSKRVEAVISNCTHLLQLLGFTWEETLDKNDRKLDKRYGEKFDSKKAVNRDLETERKELED